MDHKRKAAAAKNGDRDSKRRRTESAHSPGDNDLSHGESAQSTTNYGLTFIQMLRNTQDKSGRRIAGYFEELPLKSQNESYYKKTPMPISLRMIERHLNQGDFNNLAELESYVKRMVTNAKDFHHKNSQEYEDAERIRKATSNFMTKHNPAYKKVSGYTAQATPIPDELEQEYLDELAEQGAAPPSTRKTRVNVKDEPGDEAENDAEEDAKADKDDQGEDAQEEEEEEQAPRRSRSKRIVINVNKTQPTTPVNGKHDSNPYQGLTFQKAQEKLVDQLLQKLDEDGDPSFVNFINLPSRQFKEYFNVITDPLSLTGLQKLVVGKKGRQAPTGKTEFTSWGAFEEKASLLWENAHYFNEEGSEVYEEGTRLRDQFYIEFEQAKASVVEPVTSKIKLKVSSGQEPAASRKISINVGSVSASPAPSASRSIELPAAAPNGTPGKLQRMPSGPVPAVQNARSASASVPPSPAPVQPPAAAISGIPGSAVLVDPSAPQNGHAPGLANGAVQPVRRVQPLWESDMRAPGRGIANALIEQVTVRSRSGKPGERFKLAMPASAKRAQQNAAAYIPAGQHHVQIVVQLAPLEQQRRQYRLFVQWQDKTLPRSIPAPTPEDPLPPNALVFDAQLHPGANRLAISVVAALPRGEKLPGGEEAEVERFVVLAHLASH